MCQVALLSTTQSKNYLKTILVYWDGIGCRVKKQWSQMTVQYEYNQMVNVKKEDNLVLFKNFPSS